MLFFNENIVELARLNTFFRKVIATTERTQIVLMNIEINSEIGEERHEADQIVFFVSGEGKAIINGEESPVFPGHCVIVPAGSLHNFKNTGKEDLKLYTLYAPPQHPHGEIDKTEESAR
ncbi:cupin domain-containing protein [Candidatus Dependentiae bacterium]|nr:cupin domain-containing protein [Candidatus Dependentiae bacterium]